MNQAQLKRKISKYRWEPWLKRPFYGFMMSTFDGGNTKQAFNKIGLRGWQCDILFSDLEWYSTPHSYAVAKPTVLKWLKQHSIAEISERLEKSRLVWIEELTKMALHPAQSNTKKLQYLESVLREITTYVWAVHIAEHFFTPLLKKQVSQVFKGADVDKYIGDVSFPSKLNSSEQMVEAYKNGMPPSKLVKNFGWMRARDGFSKPYSAKELIEAAQHALKQPKHKHPEVPKNLQSIVREARELVYLRMFRMDIYYELMQIVRPILEVPAKKYHIPYEQLKYYTIQSLIKGEPKYYPPNYSYVSVGGKGQFFETPIFTNAVTSNIYEVKGTIAQMGKVRGTAKILLSVQELGKVKKGDILVTYMTSPNFLPAMKLAAGFVTNEGGLTCHAAIVAREMRKPCIIGTKIATQVFKDGDIIEVDANKGMVTLLKSN